MNLIISAESLEAIGSDELFISQVSKENLSLNLTLDSKRRGIKMVATNLLLFSPLSISPRL